MTATATPPAASLRADQQGRVRTIELRMVSLRLNRTPIHHVVAHREGRQPVTIPLPATQDARIVFDPAHEVNITASADWSDTDLAKAAFKAMKRWLVDGCFDDLILVDISDAFANGDALPLRDSWLIEADDACYEVTLRLYPLHGVPVMQTAGGRFVAYYSLAINPA